MFPKEERISEFKAAEKLLTPIFETLYGIDGKYPSARFFRVNKPCFVKNGKVYQPTYQDKEGKEQTTEFVAIGAHRPNPFLSSLFNELQRRLDPFFYGEIPLHNIHLHLDPLGPTSEELRNPNRMIPLANGYPAWQNIGYGQGYFPETRHFTKRCSLVFDVDRADKLVNGIKAVASDEDISKIKKATAGIVAFLESFGLCKTFQTLTGNGLQTVFLFKPLEVDANIIAGILRGVNRKFADILKNCNASVDENMKSPTQAIRLPGFLNIKPQYVVIPEQGRAYRTATLMTFSGHINDYEAILRLHGELKQYIDDRKEEKAVVSFSSKSPCSGDTEINWATGIRELLDTSDIEYNEPEAGVFKLKFCLFCNNKNHAVIYANKGIPRYSCHAGSCKNTWQDVTSKLGHCKKYSLCVYCGQEIYFLERTCYDVSGCQHSCIKDANNTLSVVNLPCSNTAKKPPLAEPLSKEEILDMENERRAFGDELPEGQTVYFYHAKTGAGKTFLMCQKAIMLANQGLQAVILQPSKELLYETAKKIVSISNGAITPNVIIASTKGEDEEEIKRKEKTGGVILSTFAYIGRKGETGELYKQLDEVLPQGAHVFLDESHVFFNSLCRAVNLANRYIRCDEGTREYYKITTTCPRACDGCVKKEDFIPIKKGNVREYRPIPILKPGSLDEYPTPDYSFLTSRIGEYRQVYGTLNQATVFSVPSIGEMKAELRNNTANRDKDDYIKSLLKFAYLPIIKKRIKGDGFPCEPCEIEEFATIDLFPLMNLFNKAESVLFASATPNKEFDAVLSFLCPQVGFRLVRKESQLNPFLFHLNSLQTTKNLSFPMQAKILDELASKGEKTLFFLKTEKDLAAFVEWLRDGNNGIKNLSKMVFYNKKGGRMYECVDEQNEGETSVVITIARGALATGVNKFRSFTTCIIDASHFLPTKALHFIQSESQSEVRSRLLDELSTNIKQAAGRLFRSELERKEGQQVNDTKRCKLLLFNIPEELKGITVDPSLCWFQEIHEDYFFFPCDSSDQQGADIANAIIALGKDEKPVNVLEARTKELAQKRKNALTKKQRALTEDTRPNERKAVLDERKNGQKQEKLNRLLENAKDLANRGNNWTFIYKKLRLDRIDLSERENIKKVLDL